jgi:glycosyltransferase involved in cell wall biosynthesis
VNPDSRLKIGVADDLFGQSMRVGHGRVWSRVLAELAGPARIVRLDHATGRPRRRFTPRPDVVLADGHAPLPPARVPIVVQVHEAGWFDPQLRELLDPDFRADIERHTEAAVRGAARVITPSEAARTDVITGYGLDPERIHSVAHGVDPIFNPSASGGRALVARGRNGEPAPYVLFAAMLHPRKNLAAVREAMSALAAEGLPHVLAIAGGPAADRRDSSELERAAFAEFVSAPGRVVRIDRPTDAGLAGLMAEADAFCLPSLYEGFGLTALEAMACGAPTVVSDRGALPEVAGEAALVVAPEAGAVTDALRGLLADRARAERLGVAGAERARQFTWKRTAEGWLSVLRRAAGT